MDDEDKPLPLSGRDHKWLGRALRGDDGNQSASDDLTLEFVTDAVAMDVDESLMGIMDQDQTVQGICQGEQAVAESAVSEPIFELVAASTAAPAGPESATVIPIQDRKRLRLDDGPSLQHDQEGPLPDVELSLSDMNLSFPDVAQISQLESCQPIPEEPESNRKRKIQPTQLEGANLEIGYSYEVDVPISDQDVPTLSSPLIEDHILGSPCVPVDDYSDSSSCFNPDYFRDYCSDDENYVTAPTDLSDVLENQEWGCSEDESTNETSRDTGAPEKKDSPLYTGAPITCSESLASILSFVSSEHLSCAGLLRLLTLLDNHILKPNRLIKNTSSLWKVLEELDHPVNLHYFCSLCYKIRKNASDLCDTCKDDSKCVLFFIHLPLVPQLKKLFARPGFKESLNYRETRTKINANNIEDVYDGLNYKEAEKKFKEFCTNITMMFNTDGMQVFTSNTFSLWPFYLVINELPPNKRFLSENLLIAGLWGSVVKPHPNLFLLPIYQDLKVLEEGIDVVSHGENNAFKVAATVISGTCDAPASACFMNMKQHSGFYSCPVCLIKGEKPDPKLATVFPYDEKIVLRNLTDYEEHKTWAVKNRVIVLKNPKHEEKWCGIKGPTILSHILPNIFDCMNVDAMHCVYLGQMRALLHLLFDKEHKGKKFSCYSKLNIVNARLRKMSSPHFLQRSVQTLDKLVHWKASELRSFMFYMCLPLLEDILEPEYYLHLSYFVCGVALLNKASISEQDRILADLYLNQFVSQFSALYGAEHMTHNLHKLLHLERCVRLNGPLFLANCFPFEDMNGRLANFIHGTRYVGLQIHTNLSIITQLPLMVKNLKDGPAKDYCNSILKKRKKVKVTEKISPHTDLVGSCKEIQSDFSWVKDVLAKEKLTSEVSTIQLFGRLLKNKLLYVSTFYKRGKRVSSFVKYSKNNDTFYGNVRCFVRLSCSCLEKCSCSVQHLAVITRKPVSLFEIQGVLVPHIFTHKCTANCDSNNSDVVNVSDLLTVIYKIDKGPQTLMFCEPLNDFEME